MDYRNLSFPELESAIRAIAAEAQSAFGGLSATQLNWKPDPERWSVGQCFDHLIAAHAEYLPIFDAILSGRKEARLVERLPLLPGIWGSLLIGAVSPQAARKLRAPKIFAPAQSGVDAGVVRRFLAQQEALLERVPELARRGLGGVILTSPVSRFVTYSALDACRVIAAHEKRHLQQAARVLEMPSFPKS